MKQLTDSIYWWTGSVTGGILLRDGRALLIDCPEFPMGTDPVEGLRELGVQQVDAVLLTQHRRAFSGGLARWTGSLPPVWTTAGEGELLQNAHKVWTTSHGKYHRYACMPDCYSGFTGISPDRCLTDGETICWHGLEITPVVFGALSREDCAYIVKDGGNTVAFCGGLAMAEGRIPELWSFQKALPDMMGYHGYLGGLVDWCQGMKKLREMGPDLLVPAYGPVETEPEHCLARLEQRLREYAESYTAISAVHYYFPEQFHNGFMVPMEMPSLPPAAPLGKHPGWLSRIGETTSYLLRAPSGRGILIDAGDREAIETVIALRDQESLVLDACWITHAHDDHLNAAWMLVHEFDCPILTTAAVAEVCSQPAAWFLPALPDCNLIFEVKEDGCVWQWEGFTLTALHLPGQCVAHAGLLVEGEGEKVLLCGDSFAPTGLDDYCAENRNLTGAHRGYSLCLEQLRKYGVRQLVNEHQTDPFVYDDAYLAFLEAGMAKREACLAKLLPGDIGFGVDKQWLRAWPMEQTVTSGAPVRLSTQITGHGTHDVTIRPCLPWQEGTDARTIQTRGLTSGSTQVETPDMPGDLWVHFDVTAPEKGRYLIPYDCWLDGKYLGTLTGCVLTVI